MPKFKSFVFDQNIFVEYSKVLSERENLVTKMYFSSIVLYELTATTVSADDLDIYEKWRKFHDKENTLLIAFGFSFEDEHIYDITKRALKNPTLRLMIFAFDEAAAKSFEAKFDGYSNVDIIAPADGTVIDFTKLNGILTSLPGSEDK